MKADSFQRKTLINVGSRLGQKSFIQLNGTCPQWQRYIIAFVFKKCRLTAD